MIYNLTRAVRRAGRRQICVIPLALRPVVFMVYVFFAFVEILFPVASGSISCIEL